MGTIHVSGPSELLDAGARMYLGALGHDLLFASDSTDASAMACADVVVLTALAMHDFAERIWAACDRAPQAYLLAVVESCNGPSVVSCLRAGADACMVPPASRLELVARIEAVLRPRCVTASDDGNVLRCGEIEVDLVRRAVRRNGLPADIGPRAFDLLVALLRRRNMAVSREELGRQVWATSNPRRTVDMHVLQLRRELQLGTDSQCRIETVIGIGYRLVG